ATIVVGMSMLLAEKYGRVDSLIFNLSLFLAIAITFFLALLLILCFKREWTLKIIDFGIGAIEFLSRKRWKLKKVREEAVKVAGMFHNSMEEFGRAPKVVVVSIFLSSLSWLFYLGISYMVFLALDFPIVWSVVLVTQSIVSAVKSIPMGVPFEVGLPEITMTTIYKVLGVPFGLSATATILTRILTVWLRFFIGFVAQQWLEIKTITAALSEGAEGKPKSSTAYISGENGNRKNHD
ncbi:MAG: lysylphosphatidylglycerol synthase transmembrane domain-containing protein, partial [Candidatus Bathyarchaeia archaeon]